MNKAFTKTKELVLDDTFKIVPDSDNGVVLIQTGVVKISKKGVELKKTISYSYPRISQALRKWSDLTLNNSTTLKLLWAKTDAVYDMIDKIDKEFKQF